MSEDYKIPENGSENEPESSQAGENFPGNFVENYEAIEEPEENTKEAALAPEARVHNARVNKTRFLLAAAVCSVTLAVLLFLFSPFFHISEVHVFGNIRVCPDEIRARVDAETGAHLLLFNTRNAVAGVMQNGYIAEVTFRRILPGRLHVYVTERRLTAFVEHTPGSFLYLDDNGRVLEIRPYMSEPLPLLIGLRFTRFRLGEILEVPDPAAFRAIVQYAQLLNHHDLIDRVSHINVSDTSNIRILMYNIEFNVGGISDADEKVRIMVGILDAMPNLGLIPGDVDIRVLRGEYPFRILQ